MFLLASVLLGLWLAKPTTAQAPQPNSQDYTSGPLIIISDAIQRPNLETPISKPVPTGNSRRNIPAPKTIELGNYSSEANGDIQIRMKAKVVAKWGDEYWPAMHYILDHESGSDPYAKNPHSTACGIPQATPCSKMLNVIGSLDNVEGQLDWMVNYIAARYENPIKAMVFHQAHNYY